MFSAAGWVAGVAAGCAAGAGCAACAGAAAGAVCAAGAAAGASSFFTSPFIFSSTSGVMSAPWAAFACSLACFTISSTMSDLKTAMQLVFPKSEHFKTFILSPDFSQHWLHINRSVPLSTCKCSTIGDEYGAEEATFSSCFSGLQRPAFSSAAEAFPAFPRSSCLLP